MSDLDKFFCDVRELVDAALDRLVPADDTEPVRLHKAIRWSLFGNGKRFRPAIVIATGRLFGAADEMLVRTAAAVEMIHTYSLIHDDLPAMDDDNLRRGRATAHKKFDEATAILAGDALQATAFQVISEDIGLKAAPRVELLSALTSAAAKMVGGQQLDLESEGKAITKDRLEEIHLKKTGALVSFSARSGALIAGASENVVEALAVYGLRLGLLFQITDDLLDVTQTTETLGKTASKDISAAKATYPSLFGIEESKQIARTVHAETLAMLDSLKMPSTRLTEIADFILERTS